MARRRRGLTEAQKRDLWRRWKEGESLSAIGRALGKAAPSIFGIVRAHGGFVPALHSRSPKALSLAEREEISRGLTAGLSVRRVAELLRRATSTVSREIARNGGRRRYRAANADAKAWRRAARPKEPKLAKQIKLQAVVAEKLSIEWSPEQIAGWLRREYPSDMSMHVSHETIYKSLFIQARGVLKKELISHLRTRRSVRRSIHSSTAGQQRGQIVGGVSIRERPAEAEDRALPGHWEGDLITGSKNSHIATLVERRSRFTMLVKVEGKDTVNVVAALVRQVRSLPSELRQTLTWDRGMELALHKHFTLATNVKVYFCDPQSPWQRGTNENTNRLLRQYFPHGTVLSAYSQEDLNAVALRLNQRPRKTLSYQTPAAMLHRIVASTG